MANISKTQRKENISEIALKDFSSVANSIFKTENTQNARIIEAENICNNDIFLDYYLRHMEKYGEVIDSCFSKKNALAENNTVFKIIEMLGDSIMFTADNKQKNMADKQLNTRANMDAKNKKERKFGDFKIMDEDGKPMTANDEMDLLCHKNRGDPRNLYKCKKQQITEEDYNDPDYNSTTVVYSSLSGGQGVPRVSNMLADYKALRERIDLASDYKDYRRIRKLRKHKGLLTQDQIDLKNIIKRPFGG